MKDVSIKAPKGSFSAIVGPSGAGKTTLVNLLLRFYEINNGTIRLDETDTMDLSKADLRKNFGMVLQDTWIFDGTIADNIRYGKPDATPDEIEEAAKKAQCHDFISRLSEGYDTHISEEHIGLSAGEKQLIAIARTILADPKILILDEATSQVDTRTEYRIVKAMEELTKGRTTFMIAHRLFTIRNADQIMYMENGDILEVGNHEALMKKNGRYAAMYNT
jgi:ATP-binding cassette subfamily B protein